MTRNMTDEQLKKLAGGTLNAAGEGIHKLAREFGLDYVKSQLLFETARVVASLQAFSGLLEGTDTDDPVVKKIADNLHAMCSNVMRMGVYGLVDSKDLKAVVEGPDKYVDLVEAAVSIMCKQLSADVRKATQQVRPGSGEAV